MIPLNQIWKNKPGAFKKKALLFAGGILAGLGLLLMLTASEEPPSMNAQKQWETQLQKTLDKITPTAKEIQNWNVCGTPPADWENCFLNLPQGQHHLVKDVNKDQWVYWTDTDWPIFQLDSLDKHDQDWLVLRKTDNYWFVYIIQSGSYIHLRAWSKDELFAEEIRMASDSMQYTADKLLPSKYFSAIERIPDDNHIHRQRSIGKIALYGGLLLCVIWLLQYRPRNWKLRTLGYLLGPLGLLTASILPGVGGVNWTSFLEGKGHVWGAIEWIYIVTLLTVFVIHTPNVIKKISRSKPNRIGSWTQSTLYFLSLLVAFYLSIRVVRFTVLHKISMVEARDLLHWNSGNVFWYIGIVIFISTLFVISYRIHKSVLGLGLPLDQKLLSLLIAGVLFLPFYLWFPIQIHPFAFFILSFIIIILMDLFAENVSGGLTWPFIWLTVLAACTTLLVFRFSTIRVKNKQTETLEAWMKKDTTHSNSLQVFSWAKYQKGRIIDQSGPVQIKLSRKILDIPSDSIVSYDSQEAHYFLGKKNDTVFVISRQKTGINEPVSLYALFFVLWVFIALILLLINKPLKLLPEDWAFYWTELPSLRKRIQFYILAVTVGAFGAMAGVTYLYFNYQGRQQSNQISLQLTSATVSDFNNKWSVKSSKSLDSLFSAIQIQHQTSGSLYNSAGVRLSGMGAPLLPYSVSQSNFFSNQAVRIQDEQIYYSVYGPNNQPYVIHFDAKVESMHMGPAFRQIILTLLNIYVFLFVVTGGIAVAVSNSITAPLKVLSERLKSLKLGKKNVPLNWNQKDELGELIRDYNRMILQLEESAKIMATTERETAWREMAKQVAHEIKNPLTPMKLSLQHLQFAIENDNPNKEKLFRKVSATLIEQIDNLNRIASEFSSFAKMPEPENRVVSLNEVVASIHDLFRERKDMDIRLFVPIDDLRVFADKDHLLRVMSNLVKNAIQAIPADRRGLITIKLYKEADEAVIKVSDNGKGIPDEVKEKVFKPNFTSKSSGTGLGLAICANIIEGFNGKIYFDTEVNKGTDFYVIIPLMRTKENFNQQERVPL